jgi:hypothetical protein
VIDFKFNLSFDAPLTYQEMLDRAVRGLRSQGFQKSSDGARCVYATADGRHCAWGWVDPSTWDLPPVTPTTPDDALTSSCALMELARRSFGLAGYLDAAKVKFASELQAAHDGASDPGAMEHHLRVLAIRRGLAFPET